MLFAKANLQSYLDPSPIVVKLFLLSNVFFVTSLFKVIKFYILMLYGKNN